MEEEPIESFIARLDLAWTRMALRSGADFETWGGVEVVYVGFGEPMCNPMRVGAVGKIVYTKPDGMVCVQWSEATRPMWVHTWDDLRPLLNQWKDGTYLLDGRSTA